MSRTADPFHPHRTAQAVADVVGDGCLVLRYDPHKALLRPMAVAHRDHERREDLTRLLDEGPRALRAGWAGQALVKNLSFRLRHLDAAGAVSPAAGVELEVAAAVAAPLRLGRRRTGVVVAFRDSCDFPYSSDEQRRVEQIAAGATPAEALRPRASAELAPDWQRTLEHAPAGIWATDPAGITTYVNHAACELVGAPEAALIGHPAARFLELRATLHPLAASSEQRDQILTRVDGSEVWVSVGSAPLADGRGRSQGYVHTIWEVAERRALEVDARLRASAYEAVADFAEIALAGEDFGVLVQEAVALTADLLGADYAALGEVHPGRDSCTLRAVRGWPRSHAGMRIQLPDRAPAALCLDEDTPVIVRDSALLENIEWSTTASSIKPRSCVSVAIGGGVGFLCAHSKMPGAFSEQDMSFMGLLTATLAARWEPVAASPRVAVAVG